MSSIAEAPASVKAVLSVRQAQGAINRAAGVWVQTSTEYLCVRTTKVCVKALLYRAKHRGYNKITAIVAPEGFTLLAME